jgi:peptidoglycan/xylan/chitin deacetylase (PgdA/CDA1 family)
MKNYNRWFCGFGTSVVLVFCLFSPMVAEVVNAASVKTAMAVAANNSSTQNIPVLCYHRFGNYGKKDAYSVSVAEFKRQLDIIQEEGFVPISLAQYQASWQGSTTCPEKAVLITVDDGYKDFRKEVESLLLERGYPATLFIYTDFVGSRLGVSRQDVQELQALGFDIGSHSASHPKLNKLGRTKSVYERRTLLEKELHGSRKKLQTWSKGPVLALAYPYGLWDTTVAEVATDAGYDICFTVNPGSNSEQTDKQSLKRNMILRGLRDTTFRKILYTRELPVIVWQPKPGVSVVGPLQRASVEFAPGIAKRLQISSIQAQRGQSSVVTRYNTQRNRLEMTFEPAWTRGADLLVITAQDRKDRSFYKQSWLVNVIADQPQKGK